MDSEVSRGSSGGIGEERMLCRENAERGGGARDVNGGESSVRCCLRRL
jgi:hypothetical protein